MELGNTETPSVTWDPSLKSYEIIWDSLDLMPTIFVRHGLKNKHYSLKKQPSFGRGNVSYANHLVDLKGKWDNSPGFGSLLSLELRNKSDSSLELSRLVFPAENGLDYFLNYFKSSYISFFRNGYQSWSTARSYRLTEKPLRSWLWLVSVTSSNMSNLPSNTPGDFSSEMFSTITNNFTGESFLVGQAPPFNQFLYIKVFFYKTANKKSRFELIYDFGKKLIYPKESVRLDGILMARGETVDLQRKYFSYLKKQMNVKLGKENIRGWSSWYIYNTKITPERIKNNVDIIKDQNFNLKYIQIDDGYQKQVGDWLELTPSFDNRMEETANYIREKGYIPGLWIAPFIVGKYSSLKKEAPDLLLKDQKGRPIICGYNPTWAGSVYYALDITNPKTEEYIRRVIRTIVHKWGYKFLKLDFLFAACMKDGYHQNPHLSKAEVMKYGMNIIREEAGKDVLLEGCGMPLSTGIGLVNTMRVGPDTAPFWKKWIGIFLQTQSLFGLRNSLRNFMTRSFMNQKLWINDPDCMYLRNNAKFNEAERYTQINAIILSGGVLMFSEDFSSLPQWILDQIPLIFCLSDRCSHGEALPLDFMEREIPQVYYNTSGLVGFFNFKSYSCDLMVDLKKYNFVLKHIKQLREVWTNEIIRVQKSSAIILTNMKPHSSKLFYLE